MNKHNGDIGAFVDAYQAAGLQPIPIRTDGSKAPRLTEWKSLQNPGTRCERYKFVGAGIGVIGGRASGGLEIIDFDDPELFAPWCELVEDQLPGVIQRLVVIATPRRSDSGTPGRHVCYRCDEPEGNQELALYPDGKKASIETRGEGGYVLTVGCPPACHPDGRTYELQAGELTDLPRITMQERSALFACARSFDQHVKVDTQCEPSTSTPNESSPVAEWEAATSWADILEPHGWTLVNRERCTWRRPGKDLGVSASTKCRSDMGRDLLRVFSSSAAPLAANESYTKFGAFGTLYHQADWKRAAAALYEQGFGKQDDSDVDTSRITGEGEKSAPPEQSLFAEFPKILTGEQLIRVYPERRPVVVDGLFREGDVANIIAAPKVGKSWLAAGLALSVATGRKWLNHFDTCRGRVLYVDNELHPTDAAFRIDAISRAMQLPSEALRSGFQITSFRGIPAELMRVCMWLRHELREQAPGYYKLIIIDTLSRMLAGDKSENDNSYFRSIYTTLECLASHLNSAIAIVHHASRGDQSEKSVTDMGAGAGSQSRACDCHMAIRPHSQEGWCVLDATVRSFAGSPSLSINWNYPLWTGDPERQAQLETRQIKQARVQDDEAARQIIKLLKLNAGIPMTVYAIGQELDGFGATRIRNVCKLLADTEKIQRESGKHQGNDVERFYVEK